jgi:enoyl-CoA hydratase
MTDDVLFARRGAVAFATLNRPAALNALTLEMIRAYAARLEEWAADPGVAAVVLRGAGGRAFCAGGDVRSVCRAKGEGDLELTAPYFREEYAMDLAVSRFAKPHVALWDGVVMGGGVGISLYGSHRIATERTVFAMPETAIGFFCDVGATWFLPRLPDSVGMYLGLTGARLGPADLVAMGLATHFAPSERLAALEDALATARWEGDARAAVDGVLERFGGDPGPGALDAYRAAIDRCFSADSVEEIRSRLEAESSGWAREALTTLGQRSPSSLKVVHRLLRLGAGLDLEAALALEYRLSQRFVASHDFCEGVRALLVDKDGAPRWQPDTLEGVTPEVLASVFRGL